MRNILLLFLINVCGVVGAQNGISWQALADMSFETSNNAVCAATVNDTVFVYSFSGIDSTKTPTGIYLKSCRLNTYTNTWSEIADLPDTLGKVAAGASTVNNKIYILGGYHVFQNGMEVSSNLVHVFNPITNSYLPNATPIPVPVDDHVQLVWRDSLIYVITGWSNSGNVPDIQIFDPLFNTWQSGTPLPNSALYKAFGASGTIIGDTIYYFGGVSDVSFAANKILRKGVINKENPTEITWSSENNNPVMPSYRAASFSFNSYAFWVGGSSISYNYDGISYANNMGVPPLNRVLLYNQNNGLWKEENTAPFSVMDLRGIAQIQKNQWVVCGGMEANQKVSKRTFLLTFDTAFIGINESLFLKFKFNYNSKQSILTLNTRELGDIYVYNTFGKLVHEEKKQFKGLYEVNLSINNSGLYIIRFRSKNGVYGGRFLHQN